MKIEYKNVSLKIRNLSSIFSINLSNKTQYDNRKVELLTSKTTLNKHEIILLLSTLTKHLPNKINTLTVRKQKFVRDLINSSKIKNRFCTLRYYKKETKYKKIILFFEFSRKKVAFLSDFGVN